MLIPKSYLTTPKPPAWFYDYEKVMTQTNTELTPPTFTADECRQLKTVKDNIEKFLPPWVLFNSDIVVAGGCWASELQDEKLKDIDVFVLGDPGYPAGCAIHKQKHDNVRAMMKKHYESIENNTLDYVRNNDKVDEVWTSKRNKIQFIFTKHKTRKDLIEDFDYVHCMASYTEGKLYLTRKIYSAIMSKKLIVQNNKNIQLWRKGKFYDRGYTEVFEEKKEPTLGDILAGALKTNPRRFENIPALNPIKDDYIPW